MPNVTFVKLIQDHPNIKMSEERESHRNILDKLLDGNFQKPEYKYPILSPTI